MSLWIKRLEDWDLNDRNVGLWVHDHQRNKDSVIISSFCVCFQDHSFLFELILHVVSQFRWALDGICEVIGLSWKAVIVIVEWWVVVVEDGPLWLLPVSWEEKDGLWLGELLLDFLKLFVEQSMFLLVNKGHWAASMGDENRSHVNDAR